MKAVLDHIGIAVQDLDQALAFYQEALGLDVEVPEEVVSQKIKAHLIPLGQSSLELLEATSPESPIAKFLKKRGPGVHHLTLRVEDIDAALEQLRTRGVQLIDEKPKSGAEGALVAFIHPRSAHGVLVELKQVQSSDVNLNLGTLALGELQLTTVNDGFFRLDGGAMFGTVPRTMWESKAPPDDRNRIQLAMRPLLVEANWGLMIIDCGAGNKMKSEEALIYGFDRKGRLDESLAKAGYSAESIDVVLATHLHFDHFGGATKTDTLGQSVPRFPNAEYIIRRSEWEDATRPHERNRASYRREDFLPLEKAGVVTFHETDKEIRQGVRVEKTGGHTEAHQIVYLESGGKTAVFVADMIPTTAHISIPWIMGYDLFPMDTLRFKKRFIQEAIDNEYLIFFEHDPMVAAGFIRERNGKRIVEKVL